jgi:hypothetical protein
MPETKTYTGGCHCGAVRYEVETDLEQVIACNCSICSKKGSLLTFVPRDRFRLLSGEASLRDYQFNHKVIHHFFCTTCGIGSYAHGVMPDGTRMAAINVRCLDGVDVALIKPTPFDGRSL